MIASRSEEAHFFCVAYGKKDDIREFLRESAVLVFVCVHDVQRGETQGVHDAIHGRDARSVHHFDSSDGRSRVRRARFS